MLETEIQMLKSEIQALRTSIDGLAAALIGARHAELSVVTVTMQPPEETPVEATIEVSSVQDVPKAQEVKAVTVEDLQTICTEMVRANPDVKAKIKELIASFDGAKVISKVPAERLSELKTALEALQ